MNVESEILNRLILHGSRPFLSFGFWRFQTYRKGRAFNMRWADGMYMPEELVPYYSDSARRAIFFSKFEASTTGEKLVEPEHLVLGILRESADPLKTIAKHAHISLERIRRAIQGEQPVSRPDTAADQLPFSDAAREILQSAVAGRAPDQSATTMDILVAVLRGRDSRARHILEASGITIAIVDRVQE